VRWLVGVPTKPTAQASLALTTVIAVSSPVPVSTRGLVSRDHLEPFQWTISTFGEEIPSA
jgi:hypothetical protein